MSEEIDVGKIDLVPSIGDEDLLLVWIKQPGVLRLIKSADYKTKYDTKSVVVINGLVQAEGVQAPNGKSAKLLNEANQGVVIGPAGSINLIPGVGAGNAITLGNDDTVFSPQFLTRKTADDYYIPPFPVQQTGHPFGNGNPARWDGTKWIKPGAPGVVPAGGSSPADDWIGVVRVLDSGNFIIYTTGKVTGLNGSGFSPGVNYWDSTLNGGAGGWTNTKPTAYGSFEGKVLGIDSSTGIVVPFKRRSGAFRPAQSSPDGAGQINIIFRSPNLPANNILAGVSKGSGTGALYRSTDNGITWTKLLDFPSGFTSLNDITLGPNGSVLLALGFTTLYTGAAVGRDWIYTIPQALNTTPTRAAVGWGSVGKNLTAIAFDGSYTYAPMVTRSTIINMYRAPAGSVSSFTGFATFPTSEVFDTMIFGGQVYYANLSSIYRNPASGGTAAAMPGATFAGETLSRIAANTVNNKTVLVGTKSGNIYRTEDFTAATPTWSAAIKPGDATIINDLAFGASVWFAATNKGLYRSSDDGKTWSKMHDNAGVSITAVAVDATGKVWIGDANGKIYVSGV